jgi:hypothetical protein
VLVLVLETRDQPHVEKAVRRGEHLPGSFVSTGRLWLRTSATGTAFALEATCWGSFDEVLVNASSAPNFRFFGAPPKEPKPIAAAISGSISMSIFDVAVVDFVVQCPGRWAEWNGDHGKSASALG